MWQIYSMTISRRSAPPPFLSFLHFAGHLAYCLTLFPADCVCSRACFSQLCAQFPRLSHPIFELQTAIHKHNLGETFWDSKKETFTEARRAVGVEKIR